MKFGILLLLTCLQVAAQSNYTIFEAGNFQGLKDQSASEVLPAIYDRLGWSNNSREVVNELIGYQEHNKWGLLTIDGKKIIPAIYDKIEPLIGDKIKVAVKGKFTNRYFYGIIDTKGKLKLNLDYFEIKSASTAILITTYEDGIFRMGALSSNLATIAKLTYQQIEQHDQLLVAKGIDGYVDVFHVGGSLLETHLEEVVFKEDYLITRKGGKDGLVSLEGNVLYPPIHKTILSKTEIIPFPTWEVRAASSTFELACDSLQYLGKDTWLSFYNNQMQIYNSKSKAPTEAYRLIQLNKDMVIVQSIANGDHYAVNATGYKVMTASDSLIYDGQFVLAKNGKQWSVHSRLGTQITDRTFDQVMPLEGHYVGVKKFGYWAILDGLNKSISDFRYDSIASIQDYKAIVKYVNKWGVFHTSSGWMIQPEYDRISYEMNHFIGVKGYSYYLQDAYGELIFKTIDQIVPAGDHFILKYEHLHSAIGTHGMPVANTSYLSVTKMDKFFALDEGTHTAVVSSTGRFVIKLTDEIDEVCGYGDGLFVIKKNGAYGFVDEDAKLRIANRYDSAKVFSEGLAPVKIRGNWGFINKSEHIIIQPYYQSVSPFINGMSIFKLNGKYGLMNSQGTEVLAADYQNILRTDNGLYFVQNLKNKWGLVDAEGVARLSPAFDQLVDLGGNKLLAKQNGKSGLLDHAGKILIPFSFQEIVYNPEYVLLKH